MCACASLINTCFMRAHYGLSGNAPVCCAHAPRFGCRVETASARARAMNQVARWRWRKHREATRDSFATRQLVSGEKQLEAYSREDDFSFGQRDDGGADNGGLRDGNGGHEILGWNSQVLQNNRRHRRRRRRRRRRRPIWYCWWKWWRWRRRFFSFFPTFHASVFFSFSCSCFRVG